MADAAPGSRSLLIPGAALLWGLQFAFLNPTIGLLLAALYGATPGQVGWALTAYNISGFVSTLIVPTRADRSGDYVRPMVVCGVLTVLLVTALALVTTLPLAVLALVALGGPAGVGLGLLFAHQRVLGASVAQIMRTRAVFSFAWIAGPPVATVIMGVLGNRSILWTIAIIGIGSIAVSVALARAARAAARDSPGVPEGGGLLDAIRRREIGLLVGGLVLLGAANMAAVSVTNLFVTDRLDLHVLWGGVALGVAAALEIPFLLVLGRVAERVAPRRLLVLGAVSAVTYYAAMMLVNGPISLVGVQIFNAASIAAVQGIGLTVLQDALPGPGLASGLFMNSIRVGAVLAGPLITLGATPELGYAAVFLGAAVIAALGLGLTLLARMGSRELADGVG